MIDFKTLSNKFKVKVLSYKIYLNILVLDHYHFSLIYLGNKKIEILYSNINHKTDGISWVCETFTYKSTNIECSRIGFAA